MDYVFIVFNFLFIVCSVFVVIYFYIQTIPDIHDNSRIILLSISDVLIHNYELPIDFDTFSKRNQKIYIIKNLDYIEMVNLSTDYTLFEAIDNERKKLNISDISQVYEKILRDFMLEIPQEAFFFYYKNIFRIADDIYLINGNYDEIVNKIKNGDKELLKVICNDKITKCTIVTKAKEKILNIFIYGETMNRLISILKWKKILKQDKEDMKYMKMKMHIKTV